MSENSIENLMNEERTFDPPEEMLANSNITAQQYEEACRIADDDPERFWAERARELLLWKRDFKTALESNSEKNEYKWFAGAG